MQVTGIGWTGILTGDFESTLHFFSRGLGLSLAYQDQDKQIAHFRLRTGQLFEVYGPRNRQRKAEEYSWYRGPALGFEVDDVPLAYQEMLARGARFITGLDTWEDNMWSMFLGPDDRLFEILKPARRPAGDFKRVLGISGASLPVQDVSAAVQFFSGVMEMPPAPAEDRREVGRYHLPGGQRFEILGRDESRAQRMQHICIGFEAADLERTRCEMELQGIEFIGPTELLQDGYARAPFYGPDAFLYELTSGPAHLAVEP